MEQNETKRGAFSLFSTPKMTLIFAIKLGWISSYESSNLLIKSVRAPRTFVKLFYLIRRLTPHRASTYAAGGFRTLFFVITPAPRLS